MKPNKYYVILYGTDLLCVGRVITVNEDIMKFIFMPRLPGEKYNWYKKKKIEDVNTSQIICGPLTIQGGLLFHIIGVEKP